MGMTASGHGAQSLSNLVEVFWLIGAAVTLTYAKVFVIGRTMASAHRSTYALTVFLAVAAVLLRLLMPGLPE